MNYNYPNYQGFNSYQNTYQNTYQNAYQLPNYAQQPMQQIQQRTNFLQGKVVDSFDVVKSQEINLDGSVTYFPLSDGSSIVTRQLMVDGTSKTTIYKPVVEKSVEDEPKVVEKSVNLDNYVTLDAFNTLVEENKSIKDELKELKKQINKKGDK